MTTLSLLQSGNEAYVDEKFDDAFDLYTAALAANDGTANESDVLLKRSQCQLKRGKAADALADAEAAIKLHYFSDLAHLRAGIALFELGRLDDALKSFLRGVDMARGASSGQFTTWIAKTKLALHEHRAATAATASAPADVSDAELAEAKRDAAALNAVSPPTEASKPRYRHVGLADPGRVAPRL
jgi:tetratricopeptide (TPR) repeat protein